MTEHIAPAVSIIISDAIKKDGLTIRETARQLGVAYQAVDFWRRGVQQPGTDTLIRILLKSKTRWARRLAKACLDARYPGVFRISNR